jgi:hypothetical protein
VIERRRHKQRRQRKAQPYPADGGGPEAESRQQHGQETQALVLHLFAQQVDVGQEQEPGDRAGDLEREEAGAGLQDVGDQGGKVELERLAAGVALKEDRAQAVEHVLDVEDFLDVVGRHFGRHRG